jgi:transcriptional regulator with XRE-family HTH domain
MERLAHLRRQRLLTQRELAEQVGVTLQAVQNWEAGKRWPRLPHLRRLCAVLNVSLDELLTPAERERLIDAAA